MHDIEDDESDQHRCRIESVFVDLMIGNGIGRVCATRILNQAEDDADLVSWWAVRSSR